MGTKRKKSEMSCCASFRLTWAKDVPQHSPGCPMSQNAIPPPVPAPPTRTEEPRRLTDAELSSLRHSRQCGITFAMCDLAADRLAFLEAEREKQRLGRIALHNYADRLDQRAKEIDADRHQENASARIVTLRAVATELRLLFPPERP